MIKNGLFRPKLNLFLFDTPNGLHGEQVKRTANHQLPPKNSGRFCPDIPQLMECPRKSAYSPG